MRENERTRQSAVATRDCPTCDWEIVTDSADLAEVEAVTHRVEEHTTEEERARIGVLVEGYQRWLDELPARVLLLAVWEVLDTPTTPALALVPVDVDGTWPADTVEAGDVVAERGAAA
ncbi:hypothetical protein Q8791_30485 [Nocardiopsis sp. CT-R113]|uniref:DUF2199 domain-containing protein n=1 Tax=Nocardiopsis codii TaxID=3065942 RepID=A0ABU7KH42_9ACTN|nr:hypothetical protein [Nocardiopsis sp. CT-R113]MEE2041558.1 hypothetical protein [Nocardiopsis sp. CT-R113]